MINELIPPGLTGKALFDFVVKNEAKILHAKKSQIKQADCFVSNSAYIVNEKGLLVQKDAGSPTVTNESEIDLSVVINTTNWFDSHRDVHLKDKNQIYYFE